MRLRLYCMMLALALVAPLAACSTSPETKRDDERAEAEAEADKPRQAERYDEMRGEDERDEQRQTEATEDDAPVGGGPMGDMDRETLERHCPMQLEDVEVDTEEVEQGIAMLFSTDDDDDLQELRERVQWLSDHHNEMLERSNDDRPRGRMHRGGQDDDERRHGMMRGKGMAPMPEAHARVEQTDDGARLVLTARDDDNVEALREHIDERVDAMQERGCPMMYDEMDDKGDE
ncbi:MAG: hypothetical protein ACOCV2_00535 [Persicimonas sp.]